jgi:hypothetical protein
MSKDYKKELNTMYHLMNFGRDVKRQSTLNEGIVEYSQLGANGKTYGIIKEGTKYYIKVAPKKHTKILAEDYDYVGGYLNRKAYDSYTKASNALNLHLISVNESNGKNTPVKSQFNLNESAEWANTQTKEAREDLNRFYQLVSRVDNLLNENVHYINENDKTYSEKPTKSPKGSTGKGGQQQPTGIKEKDWVKDNSKVDADKVYDKNGVKGKSPSGEYDAASGINDIDMTQGNPYQEKSKTSKEQGKNVFEGKRTIKISESQEKQIQAWRNKRAFVHTDADLDNSHTTEIGDTAPYVENVNESFETSEWDEGLPSTSGIGDAKQYTEPFEETLNEEFDFNELEGGDLEGNNFEFNDLEIPESDDWKDLKDDKVLKNAQLSNDRIEYQLNKYGDDPLVDEYYQDSENEDNNNNDMFNDTSINKTNYDSFINEDKLNQIISKNVKQLFEGRFKESDKFGYGHKTDANNLLNSDFNEISDEACEKIYDYLNKHGESTESLGLDVNSDEFTEIEPDEVNPDDNEESLEGYEDTDAHDLHNLSQTGFKNHWDSETAAEQGNLYENRLNDFGKHPAYRKKVMSLPQIGDESQWGRDWNDESTKSDKPFGIKIGHSGDPFTDLVNTITDAVVTEISKKKV